MEPTEPGLSFPGKPKTPPVGLLPSYKNDNCGDDCGKEDKAAKDAQGNDSSEIQLRLPSLAPIVLHWIRLFGARWRVLHIGRIWDFIVDGWTRSQLWPQLGILLPRPQRPRRFRGEVDWLLGERTSSERPPPLSGVLVTTSWPCPLGITEHWTLPDHWRSEIIPSILLHRVRQSLAICLLT